MARTCRRAAQLLLAFAFVAALSALSALSGCYKYVLLPGEVKYETVSPPYVLQLVNGTGRPFVVECIKFCDKPGTGNRTVADGGSFELLMQVRKFRVTETDTTGAHQVMDAPYIYQDGSNTAVIRVRHMALHELSVDLESPKWFAPRVSATPQPASLRIDLRDFSPRRWFRDGPP